LNHGVDLQEMARQFDPPVVESYRPVILELTQFGLLHMEGNVLRLTPRGRLLSNEVFQAFLTHPAPASVQ
jgi:coproporphyrinogen III oxidase-like Fe-S oxidoreductase